MTLLALTGGETALIVLAAFWGLLVLFLCLVLVNTFRVLEATRLTVDAMREETVPLLREIKGSVERTNGHLDRVGHVLDSVGGIVGRVERLTGLIEHAAVEPDHEVHQRRGGREEGRRVVRQEEAQDLPAGAGRDGALTCAADSGSRSGWAPARPAPILASRWAKRQTNKVKPATLAREAKGGLMDLSKLVAESIEEGKRAMEERERELRAEMDRPRRSTSPIPTNRPLPEGSPTGPSVDSARGGGSNP